MDSILTFIGLMKKAGALAIGAEHASEQALRARLFCIAADAAENTLRAVSYAAQQRGAPVARLKFSKLELGAALGQKECAALAITNAGFARALAQKLGLEVDIKLPRPKVKPKSGRAEPRTQSKAANAQAAVRRKQMSAPPRKKAAGRAKGLNKGDRV